MPIHVFTALINNNVMCHDKAEEFVESVEAIVGDAHHDVMEQQHEPLARGFLDLASSAKSKLVVCILNDPGMPYGCIELVIVCCYSNEALIDE